MIAIQSEMKIMTQCKCLSIILAQSCAACVALFVQSKDIKLNLGHRHETATSRWFPNPLIFFRRTTLRCVLKLSQWIFKNIFRGNAFWN